jgi:hypothetical protein
MTDEPEVIFAEKSTQPVGRVKKTPVLVLKIVLKRIARRCRCTGATIKLTLIATSVIKINSDRRLN